MQLVFKSPLRLICYAAILLKSHKLWQEQDSKVCATVIHCFWLLSELLIACDTMNTNSSDLRRCIHLLAELLEKEEEGWLSFDVLLGETPVSAFLLM